MLASFPLTQVCALLCCASETPRASMPRRAGADAAEEEAPDPPPQPAPRFSVVDPSVFAYEYEDSEPEDPPTPRWQDPNPVPQAEPDPAFYVRRVPVKDALRSDWKHS